MRDISEVLKENKYPGRGIIIGLEPDGKNMVAYYFLTGRSEGSQNRMFVETDGGIEIRPIDPSLEKGDPSLLIYSPIKTFFKKLEERIIVSNGSHTDIIYDNADKQKPFREALEQFEFEPDGPIYTPRIAALISIYSSFRRLELGIVKSKDQQGRECVREYYQHESKLGHGYYISTYEGNGNPPAIFNSEPVLVEIEPDYKAMTQKIFDSLDPEYRVAACMHSVNMFNKQTATVIINK